MATPWILATEDVVGRNHPTLADVANRPLRYIFTQSGLNPDADFKGFVALNPGVTQSGAVQISGGITALSAVLGGATGSTPLTVIGDAVTGGNWFRAGITLHDTGAGGHQYVLAARDGATFSISDETSGILIMYVQNTTHDVVFKQSIYVDNTTVAGLLKANGSANWFITTTTNHPIVFGTNTLGRWVIDTSGNLTADTNGGYIAFRVGAAADIAKAAGVWFQVADVSTASSSEVSIASKTLKANSLNANGQLLEILLIGSCDTQAGTLIIKLGADEIMNEAIGANVIYRVTAHIWRLTGAAAWRGEFILTTGSGAATVVHKDTATKTSDLSTDLTFDIRGLVTAGGTLRVREGSVRYNAA